MDTIRLTRTMSEVRWPCQITRGGWSLTRPDWIDPSGASRAFIVLSWLSFRLVATGAAPTLPNFLDRLRPMVDGGSDRLRVCRPCRTRLILACPRSIV